MAITDQQRKLLDAGALIASETAGDDDHAFLARQLVQATLPHKNPGDVPAWTRTNGDVTLMVRPGWDAKANKSIGYPYGTVPRLLLFWMTTEAVQKKSPRLELGDSLASFMVELGLDPSRGGKRSDATRLKEQLRRLIHAQIALDASMETEGASADMGSAMLVSRKWLLWWNEREPAQRALWGSYIELTDDFYKALTANPVPVDVRALKALKKSPLALDLYAWLTYEAFRAQKRGKARFVSWGLLMQQLGTEYNREDNFRAAAKAALRKIRAVYPGLKLGGKQGGIEVLPTSTPAIQSRREVNGKAAIR